MVLTVSDPAGDVIEATATEDAAPTGPVPPVGAVGGPIPEPDPVPVVDWHTPSGHDGGYTWNELQQLSLSLAQSSLVPAVYRKRPENIVMIALTGQEIGWGVLTAMRFVHIIEGKPTISPEGMLALVRRAGHSVKGQSSSVTAKLWGRRCDNGDEMEVEFSMADAQRAKLDRKDNWQMYPEAMLWARALAMLCRRLFPDVLLGVAYIPEEMGANVDINGNPTFIETTARDDTPVPDWAALGWDGVDHFDAARRDTKRLLDQLPADSVLRIRNALGKAPPDHQYTLNIWAVRHGAVVDVARQLGIVDEFAETAPSMTDRVGGGVDPSETSAVTAPGSPPPTEPVDGPEPAAADPQSGGPALIDAGTGPSSDDDEADRLWVAEALAAEGPAPSDVTADDEADLNELDQIETDDDGFGYDG